MRAAHLKVTNCGCSTNLHLYTTPYLEAEITSELRKIIAEKRRLPQLRHCVASWPTEGRRESLVSSQITYSAVFLQNLQSSLLNRINTQINRGIKVFFLRRKFVSIDLERVI